MSEAPTAADPSQGDAEPQDYPAAAALTPSNLFTPRSRSEGHGDGMAKVVFKVRAEVNLGETVAIWGNHLELGSFFRAFQLTTTPQSYPIWTFPPITVPMGVPLQYKYVRPRFVALHHRMFT